MREPPSISHQDLHRCLRDQYGLVSARLEFLPRGLDYSAGLYRVVMELGTDFLLKVSKRPLYAQACLVPAYLREQGITSVVAPIRTESQALWTNIGDWRVIVYPFIEGQTGFAGMMEDDWYKTGTIFRQIHQVRLPPEGFDSLQKETFDPTRYAQWIRAFETQHLHRAPCGTTSVDAIRASWVAHQAKIQMIVTSLENLAGVLRSRSHSSVICHADLHPANLIRDDHGRVFVIDWDEVMLAPPERDFIFIREPEAEPFWEGYGQREMDWTVLTYYRWERVAQDLIECAQNVWFRDDLGEESKADAARMFDVILAEGGSSIVSALSAAAHLVT